MLILAPCSTAAMLKSIVFAERELVLFKVRAPPGPARTEVMQLSDVFRARVVDVSERSITLCATGDIGKVRNVVGFFLQPVELEIFRAWGVPFLFAVRFWIAT